MIHSRPGYAPRTSDDAAAKLNADMIPAVNRKPLPNATKPVEISEALLDARTEAAMKKLALEHPVTEVIDNPNPSEPPKVLSPGK